MVISITMKNVVLRGATHHFRMAVPKECQHTIVVVRQRPCGAKANSQDPRKERPCKRVIIVTYSRVTVRSPYPSIRGQDRNVT